MRSSLVIIIGATFCYAPLGVCQMSGPRTSILTDKSRDRDFMHSQQEADNLNEMAANSIKDDELELDQRLYDALSGMDRTRTTGASLVEAMRVYTAAEMPRKIGPRNEERYDAGGQGQSMRESVDDDDFQKGFEDNFKPHNLCEWWNSGQQTDELTWSESADRILRVIGNGVVKNGYNMFLAPGQTAGQVTEVKVALYIESMSSFKAQTMDFEVDMYLAMSWFDRRLAHNCTHPILIAHKFVADRIWHPDLYFVNSKFAYFQEVTTPNFMVFIYPDGLIFKSMRVDVTLSCMMDLKRFPMDKQECPIVIQSYAYIENLLNLSWHVDPPTFPIANNAEIKLSDMVITDRKWDSCAGPYPMFRGSGRWSCVRAMIVMKRLVLFHVIQTYFPTGMLVLISWMSFWLDPRASPARISLTITTLLTLTTMSNGARQDLPQVSYVKALDIWLAFCQGLIFLVLLEYTWVSFYITRREKNCEHVQTAREMSQAYQHFGQSLDHLRQLGGVHVSVPENHAGEGKGEKPQSNSAEIKVPALSPPEHVRPDSPLLIHVKQRDVTYDCHGEGGISNSMSATAMMCRSGSFPDAVRRNTDPCALLSATGTSGVQQLLHKYEMGKPCQICTNNFENIAKQIDKKSRIVFPFVFSVFTIVYWLYYSWYTREE